MYSEPFCLELAIYHSYARSQCEWIGMFEAEPGAIYGAIAVIKKRDDTEVN